MYPFTKWNGSDWQNRQQRDSTLIQWKSNLSDWQHSSPMGAPVGANHISGGASRPCSTTMLFTPYCCILQVTFSLLTAGAHGLLLFSLSVFFIIIIKWHLLSCALCISYCIFQWWVSPVIWSEQLMWAF